MSGLNAIEQECRVVLAIILDLMGPGRRKVSSNEHTELMGRVRDCMYKLINKEHGCPTGTHSGYCTCTEEKSGRHVCGSVAHGHEGEKSDGR